MSESEVKSRTEHRESIICSIEFQVNRLDKEYESRTELYEGEHQEFIEICAYFAWSRRLEFEIASDVEFGITKADYLRIGVEALASN